MKLKGEFVLREIAGEVILVPVGQTALHFNGIITLNQTGVEIWKGLQEEKSREQILEELLEQFEYPGKLHRRIWRPSCST